MTRIPTPALMALALAAMLVNAAATGTVAQAENDVADALGEAGLIPADAFMTGDVQDVLHIDGVSVTVRPDGDAYALVFANDTDEARSVHVAVQATETTGSIFGRIMPMPRELTQVVIEDEIPAGARLTHRVGRGIYGKTAAAVAEVSPPAALLEDAVLSSAADNVLIAEFVTHSFQLLPLSSPEAVAIGALRVDASSAAQAQANRGEGMRNKVAKEVEDLLLMQLLATK